jgi:hypothetical protein
VRVPDRTSDGDPEDGKEAARAELRQVLLADGRYEAGVAALDDPDLADE